MDKQKQIEEMYEKFLSYKFKTAMEKFSYKEMCEHFYNAGYRKIPEGSVVLTGEEYYAERKRWEKLAVIKLDEIDKTVKETAEKFAKESKQRLKDKLHRGKALHTTVFGKEYVRRIFKEVIDEICKEITEDKV